ncbi:hypothetical protein [Agrococcus beijingensis]|uniref:hypothetical protein n=1 Tax=Agrococcus beijingensis TaxID=3068634 RepID=UPI002742676F|nr:hypothetical protein [Agrococcus sp. REN33]
MLDAVGRRHGIAFDYDELDWSCERYAATGSMMPADGIERLRGSGAILLGVVGWEGVPTTCRCGGCSCRSAASLSSPLRHRGLLPEAGDEPVGLTLREAFTGAGPQQPAVHKGAGYRREAALAE